MTAAAATAAAAAAAAKIARVGCLLWGPFGFCICLRNKTTRIKGTSTSPSRLGFRV